MSYKDQLRGIVKEYRKTGQRWPASTHEIASWAMHNELWAPQHEDLLDQCAQQLAEAMREEYVTDPQGRRVRAKHAAREGQAVLWADIRDASREHMAIAFAQRRQQIVGDCRQLKADVDSFNENRAMIEPIQTSFDFTLDLMELALVER
jgi:hypothetical protein